MFTPEDRERLRDALLDRARGDPRITGAAITGSGSAGDLDAWSDIDLGFGVRGVADVRPTLEDFTDYMRREHAAVDTVDVVRDPWIYRVFLLPSTLQVDLAFAPSSHFGARAPTFRLVFGDAADVPHVPPPDARELIGYAWLYALHARSSIARGRPWQAEYMISAMRDQVIGLACVRHGLPAREARGVDRLPAEVTRPLERALVATLDRPSLLRAFGAAAEALKREMGHVDDDVGAGVGTVLDAMLASLEAYA